MGETAELKYGGKTYSLPVKVGSENEKAVDIAKLRGQSGLITLDSGYANTGACESAITYLDGESGVLRYRGIPIEELAERSNFLETSYLLIWGELPTRQQLDGFEREIKRHTLLHEDFKQFFDGYPTTAHPMAILSAMVASLSSYYYEALTSPEPAQIHLSIIRLMAKLPTIAAFSHKKSVGQPFIYPQNHLSYCGNFLHMMFAVPAEPYFLDPTKDDVLNLLLILHADHEQNCSTSTVRLVGSARANLYASIAAGICALWGPLHGGANQAVIEMLTRIHDEKTPLKDFVARVKDKNATERLMGFGHRVYKNFDPRANIIKRAADTLLSRLGINDPLLEIAKELEGIALNDDYFISRKLYPNVDFYSGVIYRALGIPTDMFTVMFALGRLPGWIAHWREMMLDKDSRIGRPRQVYTGPTKRPYVPLNQRG
ncbi:MAG: citrate synthase [Planctomycetes bacterium]|nr:citrate synthase [Planctomycetota bacterium]